MVARTGINVAPVPPVGNNPPAGQSATDGRLVFGGLYGTNGGCITGGGFTASGTQMQVTVGSAVWRIPDPTNVLGVHLSPADPYTFTFSAGPASGSRIDVLWVKQNNFENNDADSRVTYGVAAGVAAATPAEPAVPGGAMKIARLTVPAGVSNAAACTLVATYGGQTVAPPTLIVGSEPQLPAAGAYYGQLAIVNAVTVQGVTFPVTERWNGSTWRRWDSDFVAYTPNVNGPTVAPGFNARWRYRSGRVTCQGRMYLSGGTITGSLRISLPVNPDGTQPDNPMTGTFQALNASDSYRVYFLENDQVHDPATPSLHFVVRTVNATTPGIVNQEATGSVPFNEPWATSDTVRWALEYDPA